MFIRIFIPQSLLDETRGEILTYSNWSPQQFIMGGSLDVTKNLRVDIDYVFQQWSKFKAGGTFDSNNEDFVAKRQNFDTKDIWIPRFGVEYRRDAKGGIMKDGQLALRGGYSFRESPFGQAMAPDPVTGEAPRTLLVDNDVHMFSAGLDRKSVV